MNNNYGQQSSKEYFHRFIFLLLSLCNNSMSKASCSESNVSGLCWDGIQLMLTVLNAKTNNGFVGAYVCNACRSHLSVCVCAGEHDTENLLHARMYTEYVCSFLSLVWLLMWECIFAWTSAFSLLSSCRVHTRFKLLCV